MSHGTGDTPDAAGVPDRPNGDRPAVTRRGGRGDVSERMWAYDFTRSGESPEADDLAADLVAGPTRYRSVRKALRRLAWLWCLTTVLGLAVGLGLTVKKPLGYQASTSVMLAYGPDQVIAEAGLTDLSLAQSRTLAEETLQRLGLHETLAGFIGSYSVTAVADRILQFTVTAPTSDEAVRRANVLAAEFLQFRAALLENQQQLVFAALNSELAHAPAASAPGLQAAIATYRANMQVDTTSAVNGSKVLNVAAPIRRSLRKVVTYPGGGLLAGLGLGMGIIILLTLVSDRPRRRDDVAGALGAPVRFSIGKIRPWRWLPGWHGRAGARRVKIRRIAGYLHSAARPGGGGLTALAVVPVGNPRVAALSVVSLAQSCAQQGLNVVLADLCRGAPAARLLRAKAPGVHEVHVDGMPLTVTVPDRDDLIPAGPLGRGLPRTRPEGTDPLSVACGSADLLLTLADLDPALGAEHLPEWAADVVVMVTAGRSSSAKIHVVSEMIRLAGLRVVSGVLVGADKTDESLGTAPDPVADADQANSVPQPRVFSPLPAARQAESR
jgi:capsular polysaccharide biosynthesis protein